MRVLVEFFGIPRQRAGVAEMIIERPSADSPVTLGEILKALAAELPDFARHCLEGDRLQNGYIANLGGRQFITDPSALIQDGENLLILSADAGG